MRRAALTFAVLALAHGAASAQWRYERAQNMLGEDVGQLAKVVSVDGNVTLVVVRTPSDAWSVSLRTRATAVACSPTCEIRIRFNDDPSIPYDASAPDDGGSTIVGLAPAIGIAEYLQTAQRVRLVLPLRGKGNTLVEFRTRSPLHLTGRAEK